MGDGRLTLRDRDPDLPSLMSGPQPSVSPGRITSAALQATLLLLALALPFESVRPIFRVGSLFEVTNLELILGLTALAWAVHSAVTRRRADLRTPLTIPILLFLALAVLSAAGAPSHRSEALKFTTRFLSGAYAFFLVVATITTRERFMRLLAALLAASLLSGLLGIAEAAGLGGWPLFDLFKAGPTRVGGQLRVSASFQYATIAAMYFEMALPLLLGAVIVARRRPVRFALLAATALLIESVVLSLTRAGLIALAAAFLSMAALAWLKPPLRRALVPIGAAFTLMILLVAVLAVKNSTVLTRLQTEDEARWYGASYRVPPQLVLSAGEAVTVPVWVKNTGVLEWQVSGDHAFAFSYQWLSADGKHEVSYPRVETALPRNLASGESVELSATVRSVPQPGTYLLAWGMLQRDIAWFKDRGIEPAYTRVEVTPGARSVQPPEVAVVPRDETVHVNPPVRRFELWSAAVRMVMRHPWLGVGPDNFRHVFGEYAGRSEWNRNIHANNLYLEMFADLGLLGGLAFLAILAIAAGLLVQSWWTTPGDSFAPWTLALVGSLVAFLVHGLLDYFLEFVALYLFFWMLLGLIVSSSRLGRQPAGGGLAAPKTED